MSDLMPVAAEAAHARKHLPRWMRPRMTWPGRANLPGRSWTVAEPKGTVLVIAPWNYPVQLALAPLVAAVAAGNTVVVKPSELAPATSAALARLLPQYVDPEGVAVVEGGVDVSTELLDLPFDHLFFTGSTTVGKVVMAAAARHLSSVTLELGGKSPVVVTGTPTSRWPPAASPGASCSTPARPASHPTTCWWSGRWPTGWSTPWPGRWGRWRATTPRSPAPGSSTPPPGPAGVPAGRARWPGGRRRLGRPRAAWIEPTVVVDPDPGSALMREEIFGPILPVVTVDSAAEAVGVHQPARTSPWPCTCSPARGPPNRRSSTRPPRVASA